MWEGTLNAMILRRVIHHFRKQEWAAIALDFLIVVAGILLAFQITEWNELRAHILTVLGEAPSGAEPNPVS